MKKGVQTLGRGLACLLLALGLFAQVATAASSDVGIEPAYSSQDNTRTESIFIMQLKTGESGKNGIKLINNGKESHTVNLYAVDGSTSVDGSFSCKQKAETVSGVGKWVKLDETNVTIEPGEQKIVDFTVTAPDDIGPGEHNGCVVAQDLASLPAKTGEGVLLGFRSAIRLAVTTPGEIIKKLTITKVEVSRLGDGSYQVLPIAKNEGNVSLDVKSYAQLHSIFGQESKLKSDATCPLMPGATMACPYTFERPYWGGIYKAKTSLSYNSDPNDGLGQNVNEQHRVRRDSGWFFAIPDPLAGAAELAVLLVLLWLIITPIRHRLRRRRIIRRWEKYTVAEGDTLMSIAAARNAKWRVIAKHNRIKAPYLLEKGQVIIAPKIGNPKKTKPVKKSKNSELDWFDDASAPAAAETPKPAPEEKVADELSTPSQETTPEPPALQPAHGGWVSPRSSSYEDEEDYDEDFVDWREGADYKEVSKLEHRLEGTAALPRLKSQLPTSKPSTKKPSKKR